MTPVGLVCFLSNSNRFWRWKKKTPTGRYICFCVTLAFPDYEGAEIGGYPAISYHRGHQNARGRPVPLTLFITQTNPALPNIPIPKQSITNPSSIGDILYTQTWNPICTTQNYIYKLPALDIPGLISSLPALSPSYARKPCPTAKISLLHPTNISTSQTVPPGDLGGTLLSLRNISS